MKKQYFLYLSVVSLLFSFFISCGSDDSDNYSEIPDESPVVFDITAVPYPKLSDYNFFEGEMKNLQPVKGVLPYDLNSSLFTDYALKKRFVWMPDNVTATYDTDGSILNFPTGAVLIKNFYYNNVQPDNSTKIIETRMLIKKEDGWVFANYIWNNEQTEATYSLNGNTVPISWEQDGVTLQTNYRIPSELECFKCHQLFEANMPIGPKPQNLNKNFNFSDGNSNQLQKWVEEGYLDGSNLPSEIVSTVDWHDETKPLEDRVRSYLDINCAHCHSPNTYCGYTPMNLAYTAGNAAENFGICTPPLDFASGGQEYIIKAGDSRNSLLPFKMASLDPVEMMPQIGRTLKDDDAVEMINAWINDMETPCE